MANGKREMGRIIFDKLDSTMRRKTILITRPAGQGAEFSRLLSAAGAEVISFPAITIAPPRRWEPVDTAIRRINSYDWLLFTSANGVTMFFARFTARGGDMRNLKGIRIGAIGPKTSAHLQALGLKVNVFPDEYRAEALAEAIGPVKGLRILLVRAQDAREILPQTLRARGAQVAVVTAYRTLKSRRLPTNLKKRLTHGGIDAVTFTSSSTVDGFMRHLTTGERRRVFRQAKAAVIGPITAATLRRYGIRPAIRAKPYTTEALAEAIVAYFS